MDQYSYGFHLLNVKCQETCTDGAVCREFEWEAPAAEEMLDRVVCSREQFSFYSASDRLCRALY